MAVQALALFLLVASPTLVYSQCGRSRVFTNGRIIDGSEVIPCSVPWHVHVHFPPDNSVDFTPFLSNMTYLTCGAVLLDERHVMISPTCLFIYAQNLQEAMNRMVFVAGDNDASLYPELEGGVPREQFRRPAAIFLNPNYPFRSQLELISSINPAQNEFQAFRDNQCAIVRLDSPFTFSECVNNICLPDPEDTQCTFEGCVFSGNGLNTTNISVAPVRSNRLEMIKMTALPTVAREVLLQMGKFVPGATTFAAAPESRGLLCSDDNGGALACYKNNRWFLRGTGILSICNQSLASVFADVPLCLDFINSVLGGSATATFP